MNRHPTMSEKVGLAGSVNVPMRQASSSSVLSDDAVPTGNPNEVHIIISCKIDVVRSY